MTGKLSLGNTLVTSDSTPMVFLTMPSQSVYFHPSQTSTVLSYFSFSLSKGGGSSLLFFDDKKY